MVVLHAVGPEPGGVALRATLRVTQTPTVVHRAAHASRVRSMTIAQWFLVARSGVATGPDIENQLFLRPLTARTIVLHAVDLKPGGEAL